MVYRFKELKEKKFHVSIAYTQSCAMHGHDFLEFSYVKCGTIEHIIDSNTSIVHAGDYFIVDHGTMHEYKSIDDQPLEIVNILFYPEFVDRTLVGCKSFEDAVNSYLVRFSYNTLKFSPTGITFHDTDGSIKTIVENIVSEYDDQRAGYIEYIRCLLVEMLINTMRKIGKTDNSASRSDIIIEITQYIKEHYSEKIRLSDMAQQYNYSLSHLSRKFYSETGMCFSDYVQRIRVEQGCRLLETSDKKVSEIASLCGYDNIKFFNKVFKSTLRLTPREFKKLYK